MSSATPRAQSSVVSVRRIPAIKTSKSNPPIWEVSYGSEDHGWQIIGWIEQRSLGRGHTTFYFAIGIHPLTGRHYRLEGTTDFDERVNTIADFHIDPMTCRQHLLGTGIRP